LAYRFLVGWIKFAVLAELFQEHVAEGHSVTSVSWLFA
jgi:hypothetical protein